MSLITALQVVIPADWLLWFLIILVIIGLIAIVVIGFIFAFPIAALAALLVWFLTGGDLYWTAITFLVVALLSAIIGRIWRASYHTHAHDHVHEEHHD